MTTNAFALAANLAARYPDPMAVMRSWGFGNPTMALDAMPSGLRRGARDQDDPLSDRVLVFLQDRLDPADFTALCDLVGVEPPPAVEDPNNDPDTEFDDQHVVRPGQDEPPPFRGRPNTGGAMDAARPWHRRSFDSRFPSRTQGEPPPDPRADHQRRVKLDRARGIGMDSVPAGIKPFNERFPNAGRVGQV